MSWPDGERYSRPPQSLVVTLLLSLISTLVLSRTAGVLFHQSILTRRFLRFLLRNLCSLSSCSLYSLSSTLQRKQFSVTFLSLGLEELRESFLQRLWTPVPGHLSSHSALSSNELFAPLTLWRLSVSAPPLVQTLGSCPASVAPWSSPMPPSLGRGRVNNKNYLSYVQTTIGIKLAIGMLSKSLLKLFSGSTLAVKLIWQIGQSHE